MTELILKTRRDAGSYLFFAAIIAFTFLV